MLNTLMHLQQSEFCRLGWFCFCGAVIVLKIGDLFSKCFWLEKVYTEQQQSCDTFRKYSLQ